MNENNNNEIWLVPADLNLKLKTDVDLNELCEWEKGDDRHAVFVKVLLFFEP